MTTIPIVVRLDTKRLQTCLQHLLNHVPGFGARTPFRPQRYARLDGMCSQKIDRRTSLVLSIVKSRREGIEVSIVKYQDNELTRIGLFPFVDHRLKIHHLTVLGRPILARARRGVGS